MCRLTLNRNMDTKFGKIWTTVTKLGSGHRHQCRRRESNPYMSQKLNRVFWDVTVNIVAFITIKPSTISTEHTQIKQGSTLFV